MMGARCSSMMTSPLTDHRKQTVVLPRSGRDAVHLEREMIEAERELTCMSLRILDKPGTRLKTCLRTCDEETETEVRLRIKYTSVQLNYSQPTSRPLV